MGLDCTYTAQGTYACSAHGNSELRRYGKVRVLDITQRLDALSSSELERLRAPAAAPANPPHQQQHEAFGQARQKSNLGVVVTQ